MVFQWEGRPEKTPGGLPFAWTKFPVIWYSGTRLNEKEIIEWQIQLLLLPWKWRCDEGRVIS